jgi:hypothetical protein
MANLATGWRKITAGGNTWQYYGSIDVSGLAAGTYYWSVQAIDNGYEGSDFAAEQSFVLSVGGISEAGISRAVLYPNPVTEASVIAVSLERAGSLVLEVRDISGRLVSAYDAGMVDAGDMNIPVSLLEMGSGCYFVRIMLDGQTSIPALRVVK